MFTGIVESTGSVVSLDGDNLKIETENKKFFNLEIGTSIAIDGCCLTLKNYDNDLLSFQAKSSFNQSQEDHK